MRIFKATAENKELKRIIDTQNQEIINLNARIAELEHQLEESRAKEGKGCLETMLDAIADAMSSIDFSKLIESQCNELEIDDEDDT